MGTVSYELLVGYPVGCLLISNLKNMGFHNRMTQICVGLIFTVGTCALSFVQTDASINEFAGRKQ